MGIVQLPVGRQRADKERMALRSGAAVNGVPVRPLHVVSTKGAAGSAYCAGCAGPIEFGAVVRGLEAFCSVECSLGPGGDRPA
jgi:hypothetical protein